MRSKEDRGRLDSALKKVIGAVYHFIPRIQVEVVDINPKIEAEDVEDSVRGFFEHALELELKMSLSINASKTTERRTYFWRRRGP